MHLVDNIDLILTNLWRNPNLIDQVPDIIHRIIRGSIKFEDIECKILVFHFIAVLIDLFGQYSRAGRLTYTSGSCKQQCLRQMIIGDSIVKCTGDGALTHHIFEVGRSVFSGRYNEMLHIKQI